MQQVETLHIMRDSDAFQTRMEAFRAFFQKAAPFVVPEGVLAIEQVCLFLVCGSLGHLAATVWKSAEEPNELILGPCIVCIFIKNLDINLMQCTQVPECIAKIVALEVTGLEGQPGVTAMMEEAARLQQRQELFEMHVGQYLPLTRCLVSFKRVSGNGQTSKVIYICCSWMIAFLLDTIATCCS